MTIPDGLLDLLVGIKRDNGLVATWPQIEAVGLVDWEIVQATDNQSTASTVPVDMPNMSVTVTTPVPTMNLIVANNSSGNTTAGKVNIMFVADAANTQLSILSLFHIPNANYYTTIPVVWADFKAPGSSTYKIRWYTNGGTATVSQRALMVLCLAAKV